MSMPARVRRRISDKAGQEKVVAHPKARLQEAGTRLFYAKGFHATTIRDITEACGLTPGALYNHFGSKEEVLYSIIMDGHDALGKALEAVPRDVSPSERLSGLLQAFVLHHTRFRHEAVVGDEWKALDEPHQAEVRVLRLAIRALVEEAIRAGVAAGEFELPGLTSGDPVQLAATAALDMGFRIASWFDPRGPVSAEEFARFYAQLSLRSISGAA